VIDTATKRYSLIGVLPVPDGAITDGEKYGFLGEYAGDTWPLPPSGIWFATLSVTADVLPSPLALTLDSQPGALTVIADKLISTLDVVVDG
jgi:uncharacterized membrane protein